MDLVLVSKPGIEGYDLELTDTDLAMDDGWRAAVILSVYADRRADPGDGLPAGADPRGWWGDRVQPLARPKAGNGDNPDRIGSRLWLLAREVQSSANLVKAKKILIEALAWITQDGYASDVALTVWYPRNFVLAWSAVVTWTDGTTSTYSDQIGGAA